MTDELQELKMRLVVGRKADGRCVYDEQAKAELVALSLRPGVSKSRMARECGVNANQLNRWIREREGAGAVACAQPKPPAFVPMALPSGDTTPMPDGCAALVLQARLPYGVSMELRGLGTAAAVESIQVLGRLRCSASTKG